MASRHTSKRKRTRTAHRRFEEAWLASTADARRSEWLARTSRIVDKTLISDRDPRGDDRDRGGDAG